MAAVLEMVLGRALLGEILLFVALLWSSLLAGVLVGWAWKPKWADLVSVCALRNGRENSGDSLAKRQSPDIHCSLSAVEQEKSVVSIDDFHHFRCLVEMADKGSMWHQVIDRTTTRVSYKAWQRDQQTGPPQYRSKMVYEDVTPELMRDFFWDDEFRAKWNDMIIHATTLEECPKNGTMIVHWIKKFPFFCSDREYIIGRRIWQSGGSYYCVTKVPSVRAFNLNIESPKQIDDQSKGAGVQLQDQDSSSSRLTDESHQDVQGHVEANGKQVQSNMKSLFSLSGPEYTSSQVDQSSAHTCITYAHGDLYFGGTIPAYGSSLEVQQHAFGMSHARVSLPYDLVSGDLEEESFSGQVRVTK